MKLLLCGIAALLLLIACDKAESSEINENNNTLSGRYIGTFHRTGMDTTRVSLLFTENRFEGSSDIMNYPAICGGTFAIQDNKIIFTDSCAWTANFDWSFILAGEFNIETNGTAIKIWRTNGAIKDEYDLARVVR
jgi:hypothetical protein